jgi:hypothetical protein
MSKVKSMNFSERSPMDRMNMVTPTVTGIPPEKGGRWRVETISHTVVWSHAPVIANLEIVENGRDVDRVWPGRGGEYLQVNSIRLALAGQ